MDFSSWDHTSGFGSVTASHVINWCVPDSEVFKAKINPTNDFLLVVIKWRSSAGNGSRWRNLRQPQRSDIEKWKKRYFETIYVILTAAALSWITLMQRFQRADWISFRHRFHTDFSTNAGKRFIYNLSSRSPFLSPRRALQSSGGGLWCVSVKWW